MSSLARSSSKHMAAEGVELVGDAETIERYSNVLSGVVKLTKTLSDGRQQIVGLQFAPDFLGRPFKVESAINAEAATPVGLCSFPKAAVERMMKASPELEHRLLIARHIDPTASQDSDTAVFDLPLTRADIGDFLGLTIETVSRQITKLRTDGVITVENNRHVTVHSLDRLERRAGD